MNLFYKVYKLSSDLPLVFDLSYILEIIVSLKYTNYYTLEQRI